MPTQAKHSQPQLYSMLYSPYPPPHAETTDVSLCKMPHKTTDVCLKLPQTAHRVAGGSPWWFGSLGGKTDISQLKTDISQYTPPSIFAPHILYIVSSFRGSPPSTQPCLPYVWGDSVRCRRRTLRLAREPLDGLPPDTAPGRDETVPSPCTQQPLFRCAHLLTFSCPVH